MIIASVALVVDLVTAVLTYSLSKNSLNFRAAFLHNVADALASAAVILSGVLILLYGWNIIDTLCTLLISGYVLYYGYPEIRVVIRILMQSVPVDLKISDIIRELEKIDMVEQVHHVHAWDIDEKSRSLEAHVVITEQNFQYAEMIKQQVKSCLANDFNINHSTIEFEFDNHQGRNLS